MQGSWPAVWQPGSTTWLRAPPVTRSVPRHPSSFLSQPTPLAPSIAETMMILLSDSNRRKPGFLWRLRETTETAGTCGDRCANPHLDPLVGRGKTAGTPGGRVSFFGNHSGLFTLRTKCASGWPCPGSGAVRPVSEDTLVKANEETNARWVAWWRFLALKELTRLLREPGTA
jgi:hypothetical protein